MEFCEIVSNQNAVQTLKNASDSGVFHHAYLLHGPKGTGKKTLARIFAAAVLCRGEGRPCGSCPSCRKVEKGLHPDLTVVKRPEGKGNILVEQIRSLKEQIYIRPNESEYRVVIVEESEMMNPSAANALLKVLEEPPSYLIFLLMAGNFSVLPKTIVSRCLCLEMQEVSLPLAEKWMLSRYSDAQGELLEAALCYGGGNLGRSVRYMEEEACREGFDRAMALAKSLLTEREYDILEALSPFDGDKERFLELLTDFDLIVAQVAAAGTGGGRLREAAELALKIRPVQAARIHQWIDETRLKVQYNGSIALLENSFCAGLKTIMER